MRFATLSALALSASAATSATPLMARQEAPVSSSAASAASAAPSSSASSVISAASSSAASPTATGAPGTAEASPAALNLTGAGPLGLNNTRCTPLNITVPVSSNNTAFTNVDEAYSNQTYVTQTLLDLATNQTAWIAEHTNGTTTNTNNYTIAAKFCSPIEGAVDNSSLIVATHGIGFDSRYWDFAFNETYSFVNHAGSYGRSVLIYDRLGTGNSSTPAEGAFTQVQAPTEIAILTYILGQARNTTTIGEKQWNSTVAVGHSYGSVISQAVSAKNPELLDGVVLTGYSTNTTGVPVYFLAGTYSIARNVTDIPDLSEKPPIWLATGSVASDIIGFFKPPYYNQSAFELARATEQPVTLGAFATIGAVGGPAANFSGPVGVLNGDNDLIFCPNLVTGPNCSYVPPGANGTISEGVQTLFPATGNFSTYNLPLTGHAISAHPTSGEGSEWILKFIDGNGL